MEFTISKDQTKKGTKSLVYIQLAVIILLTAAMLFLSVQYYQMVRRLDRLETSGLRSNNTQQVNKGMKYNLSAWVKLVVAYRLWTYCEAHNDQ